MIHAKRVPRVPSARSGSEKIVRKEDRFVEKIEGWKISVE